MSANQRRAPRIQILPLHHVAFAQRNPPLADPVKVSNVSVSGMGLLRESYGEALPPAGAVIAGDLVIGRASHPVTLKIMHVSGVVVGVIFVEPQTVLLEAIRRYFDLELSALSMHKVNPDYCKKEPDGTAHWIHGGNSELYYVTDSDGVLRFRMAFLGHHLEGGRGKKITGGQIVEYDDTTNPRIKATEVIREAESISKDLIMAALKFLGNAPQVPRDHAETIRAMLEKAA